MNDFPIKGWKWLIYLLGWLGVASVIFWGYQYFLYVRDDSNEKFFSEKFHTRTYYWGWVIIAFVILVIILFNV